MGEDMGMAGMLGMLAMGLLTSVVAPLLVLAGRRRTATPAPHPRPVLAVPILLGFGVLHAGLVLAVPHAGATTAIGTHAVLLAGAVVFWLPVLGRGRTRLPEAGRSVYLFLACPLLDMAAVALVVRGEEVAGVAMIVGMLPIALAAVVLTCRWIAEEERAARARDAVEPIAGRLS